MYMVSQDLALARTYEQRHTQFRWGGVAIFLLEGSRREVGVSIMAIFTIYL
jgi:hypothetical protein